MAFLDFLKDRQQSPGRQKPEPPEQQTAREMYAQREAQEKATEQPLSPEVKAQADRVMATVDKASWSLHTQSPSTPVGESHGEPMRQNSLNQDKVAAPLSPTTEHVGKVAEKGESTPEKDSPNVGGHNRATPDEIVAGERAPATSPEQSTQAKESFQNRQAKTQSRSNDRGGWER